MGNNITGKDLILSMSSSIRLGYFGVTELDDIFSTLMFKTLSLSSINPLLNYSASLLAGITLWALTRDICSPLVPPELSGTLLSYKSIIWQTLVSPFGTIRGNSRFCKAKWKPRKNLVPGKAHLMIPINPEIKPIDHQIRPQCAGPCVHAVLWHE